nr:hypothetical protein [Thecaphora frezii]
MKEAKRLGLSLVTALASDSKSCSPTLFCKPARFGCALCPLALHLPRSPARLGPPPSPNSTYCCCCCDRRTATKTRPS